LSTGIVKFFNDQKGYGFITPDDGGSDLFVHRSNVQTADQTLSDDQRVEFESGQGRKGPEAQQVRPI
jgi:CspA family cold shock protein